MDRSLRIRCMELAVESTRSMPTHGDAALVSRAEALFNFVSGEAPAAPEQPPEAGERP